MEQLAAMRHLKPQRDWNGGGGCPKEGLLFKWLPSGPKVGEGWGISSEAGQLPSRTCLPVGSIQHWSRAGRDSASLNRLSQIRRAGWGLCLECDVENYLPLFCTGLR